VFLKRPVSFKGSAVRRNVILKSRRDEESKTAGVNSRRLDVPTGNPDGILDPNQLKEYVTHQNEEFLSQRERSAALAKELLG
jgi:hypothetical protein